MTQFFNLFKKELKELLTVQTIVSMLAFVLIFLVLGNFIGDVAEDEGDTFDAVAVLDEDQSTFSAQAVSILEQAGFTVVALDGDSPQKNLTQAEKENLQSYLVIPQGFGEQLEHGTQASIEVVSSMDSFSMMSTSDLSAQSAVEVINESLSNAFLAEAASSQDAQFLKNPIVSSDTTVVGERTASANVTAIKAYSMQQSILIPIIVFLLVMYASQMTISTIASEKTDKTLETLLSAPISRLSVLGSKMCAAGVLALLMAGVYMIGFARYMSSALGGSTEALSGVAEVLNDLGLNLSVGDYLLVGIQLFLTILIALGISTVLGALAKDVKSAQGLSMPIMFLAMIPYFVTLLMDINSLPTVAQAVLYLIPFTHAFTAVTNVTFSHNLLFFGGMAYQVVLLCIVMAIAVRIFSTDRIFTMTIGLKQNKKRK